MKRIVLFVAPTVAILAVAGLALGFLFIRRQPAGLGARIWSSRRSPDAVGEGAVEALPEVPR